MDNTDPAKRIEMHDLQDATPLEKIWYRDLMPEVRDSYLAREPNH